MSRINVMQPWFGPEEVAAVSEVIASGWVAQGPRVAEFEKAFATAMQVEHGVATTSCTTALHLAMVVAGVGPGDEVVVPSFSFIATTNAPTYVGATPVFADVDRATGNVTPETVEAVLTDRTRAVVVVDQGGVPVDLDAIRAVTDPRGIVVVEDAACGAGSTYRGRPVGSGADVATWSFHPRKIVTTGEGGMLTTPHAEWADRARRLREHAMSVSAAARHASVLAPAEEYLEVGYNYRMTDLQAAVGLVQLGKLPEVVARRREIAATYAKHIAEIPEVIARTGVKSFKCYFGYEPDNPIGIVPATDGWVYAAMRILSKVPGGVINVHCENTQIASWVKKEIAATGRQDLGAYTESRPALCEVETIRRMIFLAEKTGCSLHLVHTSVGMGPVLAAEAQARGVHVTVETCPHYLTRTCYDEDLDMRAKISPPLRDRDELEGLWAGVLNGSVYSLGTDHVPFLPKKLQDIWT